MVNSNNQTADTLFGHGDKTIRQRIAEGLERHQEQLARLAKLEYSIPAKYLDMTPDQVWEKHGFSIHF